ncbi:prepilin-type N-terminal cleavage/methylation domain-containing protein [bacterium]|nr:prepilin-type N-terminal cleavage/methylation domain-containing protein [bacterium]
MSLQPTKTSGFTLIEVIVAILIMGLTVQASLDLLHFGLAKYDSLVLGWRTRSSVAYVRKAVRNAISIAPLDAKNFEKTWVSRIKSPDPKVILENLSVKSVPGRTYFVQATFFEDRNGNMNHDRGEDLTSPLWVFRSRTSD